MRIAIGVFAASLLTAGWNQEFAAAQTPGNLAEIQTQMNKEFALTKTTADRNEIVTAGSVLVLHKDGLQMRALSALYPVPNIYKDGRIQLSGKILWTDMMTPDAAHQPVRKFVAGEKCWVINIAVQNDGVVFTVYSDPFNDTRYFADLKIPFNKKAVPSAADMDKMIAEVITVDAPQQAAAPAQPSAPQPPSAQAAAQQQSMQPSSFTGDFFEHSRGLHFYLFPDGSCKMVTPDGKVGYGGQFSVSGDSVTLNAWPTGALSTIKIRGTSLIIGWGVEWVRVGDAPAPSVTPGQVFSRPTTDAQKAALYGEYFQQATSQHLTLLADGTFQAVSSTGRTAVGQYSVDGNEMVFTAPIAIAGQRYALENGKLLSTTGSDFWVRTGDGPAPAAPKQPAMVDLPPPPPPPSDEPPPPPKTIAVGQTRDLVIATWGQPQKDLKGSTKEILVYADMRVTIVDGKVTDVSDAK